MGMLCYHTACAANVLLVKGTASTPNEAEKNYADSLCRNMGRWLTELNVAHDVISDEDVSSAALANRRVVVLVYNPFPTRRELWALKSFVKQGGKLIVFYGAEPALAEMLDIKLGNQMFAPGGGKWCAIRFAENAPPHLPKTVIQESRVIRPAQPVEGKSKTIALWQDSAGNTSSDPALVQSDRGFWMSHVLLDDADCDNKKQMLLGLIAALDPSVWEPVATRLLEDAGTLGKFRSFQDSVAFMNANAKGGPHEAQVLEYLSQAVALRQDAVQLLQGGQFAAVVEKSRLFGNLLVQAYAGVQKSRQGEFRSVWDHAGTGLYPGDWDRTCRVLSANGFTDLISNMAGGGWSHYKTGILRESEMFGLHGDQLSQSIAAAHANGLKIHAWKICWKFDGAPEDMLKRMKREDRLQVSDSGQPLNWLCPSHPANRAYEIDSIKEIAANYKVDGIHLDYIRFKDAHFCYCPTCRKSFERELGRGLRNWPGDVKDGELKKQFYQWRCGQITSFVRDAAVEARKINPRVKISAAVFGKYPSCVDGVGQDWALWLKEGYADFVCPMNYTNSTEQFTAYVRSQVSLPAVKGKIFPGIGVTATESSLNPVQVIDQIAALRKEGAAGFALFDLSRGLEKEFLPLLRMGITSE